MALNPIAFTEQVVDDFLHYQLSTYPLADRSRYQSGGAGLSSTIGDYARFLQMLLNRGELDGQRLLKPETVAGMTRNQVGDFSLSIGSHGDDSGHLGEAVHPVGAALILADKSDVHRSRVRNPEPASFDQHDRVNYASQSSFLRVDELNKTITLELTIDTAVAQVMHYFEIFLPRMLMSRRAAEFLGCEFHITINSVTLL